MKIQLLLGDVIDAIVGCCAGHGILAKAGGVETKQLHEELDVK